MSSIVPKRSRSHRPSSVASRPICSLDLPSWSCGRRSRRPRPTRNERTQSNCSCGTLAMPPGAAIQCGIVGPWATGTGRKRWTSAGWKQAAAQKLMSILGRLSIGRPPLSRSANRRMLSKPEATGPRRKPRATASWHGFFGVSGSFASCLLAGAAMEAFLPPRRLPTMPRHSWGCGHPESLFPAPPLHPTGWSGCAGRARGAMRTCLSRAMEAIIFACFCRRQKAERRRCCKTTARPIRIGPPNWRPWCEKFAGRARRSGRAHERAYFAMLPGSACHGSLGSRTDSVGRVARADGIRQMGGIKALPRGAGQKLAETGRMPGSTARFRRAWPATAGWQAQNSRVFGTFPGNMYCNQSTDEFYREIVALRLARGARFPMQATSPKW